MDLFGIFGSVVLVKAVDFDLRAFCFRWVQVFGTTFGEERYLRGISGRLRSRQKKGGRGREACSTLYLGGLELGGASDRGTKISG